MATERRIERMQKEIRRELSRILREEISDPRLGMVTLTRVKVTSDLKAATVFASALGGEAEWRRSHAAIRHALGFIQQALARHLETRYVPELTFAYDSSIEKSVRLHKLLDDLSKERAARASAGPPRPADPIDAPDDTKA